MMNPHDFRVLPRGMGAKSEENNCPQKSCDNHIFTGTKLLVFSALPRQQKLNQDHFLAMIAPELPKENTNAKPGVNKKPLVVHIGSSICHDGRKSPENFARQTITRVPHPVY
jgi:hypothetical protein